MTPRLAPNVLVLGVGGILGEAWMSGFLAGSSQATGVDYRDVDAFIGTSAGSIVAAQLAAGAELQRPRSWADGQGASEAENRPGALRAAIERAGRLYLSALSPLAAPALSAATPGGAVARAALLAAIPSGTIPLDDLHARVTALRCRFDGRLRLVAVERASGRRVVFGAPGAPPAAVADAVVASCAIPGVLRAARIGGREYVDGGVWSPTNLDVALSAGAIACSASSRPPRWAAPCAHWRLGGDWRRRRRQRRHVGVAPPSRSSGPTRARGQRWARA